MSTKIRIIELAKSYGMSGRDLATKLRENGLIQAKSHMSALDPIELLQARGLLAAVGITEPGAAASSGTTAVSSPSSAPPLFRSKKGGNPTVNKPARATELDVLPPAANDPASDAEPEQQLEKRKYVPWSSLEKGAYKGGNKEGFWTYWYKNGQKAVEGEFRDGKKEGLWTYWHKNGQKWKERQNKNGQEEGIGTNWDENGKRGIDKPINHGKPWMKSDIRALNHLRKEGLTTQEIALRLGRSIASIQFKTEESPGG